MSLSSNRDSTESEFALVLGPRQLAAGLFLLITITVGFSTLSYAVGRLLEPQPASAGHVSDEEQIVVVDPVEGAVSRPAAPRRSVERASPPRTAAPAAAAPTGTDLQRYFHEPIAGQLFYQVAASDRGLAGVLAMYLNEQGVPAQVATGPDERSYRVLAGPLETSADTERVGRRLRTLGFEPFLRRIRPLE